MANTNSTNSWLDPPELHGNRNTDGTYTLSELELKSLNSFNYRISKMIQGELNLANLNKDTKQVFTDLEGNVTTVTETAAGLTVSVGNIAGEISTVSATVNGLSVADETGSYTIIDGDKLVSKDHATSGIVEIKDGSIFIKNGTTLLGQILPSPTLGIFIEASTGKYVYLSGKVQVGMYDEVGINGSLIKLASGGNMSIDSSGTVYIGASSGYSGNVDIGDGTGTININGTLLHNGVPL